MGCENDINNLIHFVNDVHQSQASALVISLGKYVQNIPKEVISFANDIGLPIIQIPWHIRFSDITESVLFEINNKKQKSLNHYKKLQKHLLEYFINGSTLNEACELIYRETKHKCIIISSHKSIKGVSSDSEKFLDQVNKYISLPTSLKYSSNEADLDTNFTTYKISSKKILYGYLIFDTMDDDSDELNKIYINRHIISPLILWFDRENTIFETQMQHQDNFIWDVINSSYEDYEKLISKGLSMGFNLDKSYIGMVASLSYLEEQYKDIKRDLYSYEEWFFTLIQDIKSIIFRYGKSINYNTMSTYQDDKLILFLESNEPDYEHLNDNIIKHLNKFIDDIEHEIKLKYPKIILSWGISDQVVNKKKFHKSFFSKSYIDAKISLEISQNKEQPGFRNICNNTSTFQLLSMISNNSKSEDIISEVIGDLILHDSKKELDLLKTVMTYIENNGNVSQSARDLHLHRQSLLYRIKLIEEITNLDMGNSDDLFLLELCVRLWNNRNTLTI